MGKIWRNSKFHDWRPIFDNFRNRLLSLFYSSSCVSLSLAKAWMHSCVGPAKFMFSRVKLGCFTRAIEKYANLTTDSPLHSTIGRYRRDFLFQCLSSCRLLAEWGSLMVCGIVEVVPCLFLADMSNIDNMIRSENTALRSVRFDKLIRSEKTASRSIRIVKTIFGPYTVWQLHLITWATGERFDDPYGLYRS